MRLALAVLAAAALTAADPTLQNGAMSDGVAVPTGWEQTWAGTGTFTPSRDTTVVASAPASLKVVVTGDKANGNVHQEIQLAAGKRLHITGKLRVGEGALIAGVAVQAFDAQWKQILWQDIARGQTTGATFQAFDGLATVPKEATRVLLAVHASGPGEFWLDDVTVALAP